MGKMKITEGKNGKRIVEEPCEGPCPIERGMRIVGGKWTGSILWHLKDKPVRFNDLSRQLSGASKKMVSQRLKEMEENKLVIRKVVSDQPVAITYEASEFGKTALKFLDELQLWVNENGL